MATLSPMIRAESQSALLATLARWALCLLLISSVGLNLACRDSKTGVAASTSLPIVPNAFGASGCVGPNQVFMPGQVPAPVALATLTIGPNSQIIAARGADVLYATGAGATLVELDFTGGVVPVETELISAGAIAALYATPAIGIVDPPELSGVAVLDATSLLVVEQTANVLLLVDRAIPDTVSLFAGAPSTDPGFADGFAVESMLAPVPLARFSFSGPTQIAPSGESPARVFVSDAGNHAIRVISSGRVTTLAGAGTPLFTDGDLGETLFDTPNGLSISCNNALVITEGNGSIAGNRVRRMTVGGSSPFSNSLFGVTQTIAGDGGVASTDGAGVFASVAGPVSPITTTGGEIYWIDSASGVLRRLANGVVDCPLAVDCVAASVAPNFTVGAATSLAQTEGGVLYALDAAAGTLFRVTP